MLPRPSANHDQLRPTGRGAEGLGDRHGGVRAALNAGAGADDGQLVEAGQADQVGLGAPGGGVDFVSEAHNQRVTDTVTKSMVRRLNFSNGYCQSNQVNEKWAAQEVFCRRVREYAEREGLVTDRGSLMLDPLAARFDLSPKTLKQFLQNKNRPRPHFETLAHIAEVIGCEVMEFWELPSEPPGVTKDRWADASDQDRALAVAFLDAIKDIPEEEKPKFTELMMLGIQLRKGHIASEGKAKTPVKGKSKLK